jgi:hypothetical protein
MRSAALLLVAAVVAGVAYAASPPPEWAPRIAAGHMLWSDEPDSQLQPNVVSEVAMTAMFCAWLRH